MKSRDVLGPVLLLLTATLWSFGGVLIKSVEWNPIAIAGMRSALALPVVLAFMGLPRFRMTPALIGGALAYVATVILFVSATWLTTAANAVFLQYTAPIYVAVIGHWWLGERALRIDWIIIVVALAGIVLFFTDQLTFSGFWGNVCALGSGIAFATMALCLRREKSGSPIASILLGNLLTALLCLPFFFIGKAPSPQGWLMLAVLGMVQLGLPYVLYAAAIKRVTALEATLITLLEPILNPLWVMLVVGERPGRWAIFGAALVTAAVLLRGVLMVIAGGSKSPERGEPARKDFV